MSNEGKQSDGEAGVGLAAAQVVGNVGVDFSFLVKQGGFGHGGKVSSSNPFLRAGVLNSDI